jgi:hypothetical protein
MKVLNLGCTQGHGFEGWFAGDDEFVAQSGRGLLECPLCGDKNIHRMPTAPRLNLAANRDPEPVAPPVDRHAAWLQAARHLIANTVDVGARFPEEARRIHYGERPARGIRGQATPEERAALQEEGIETQAFPLPIALKGTVQ